MGYSPVIPKHPKEREDLYRETTRHSVPVAALGGGLMGGALGAGAVPGKPVYAIPGALLGAAGLGGLTWGARELVAKSEYDRSKREADILYSKGKKK